MANDDRKASLAGVTNKQKVTGLLFVVIVIVIIWQVVGLFGGSGSTPAPVASNVPKPGQAAKSTQTAATTAGAPTNAAAAGGDAPQVLAQANVLAIPNDPDVLKNQQQDQKTYLEALNKLQLLKVQSEIAKTNEQISASKLAAATADKKMSDLLTKPAPPQLTASDYANNLGSPFAAKTPGENSAAQPRAQVQQLPRQPVGYVVISVSMQLNKWTAVVGAGGKLFVVNVGDTLPDGSSVASINKDGIVVEKDSKKIKINIVSSV